MMTNREILSAINEKGGGVAFADGGDIPKDIKRTGASYKYGGRTMTDHEIYKYIIGGHLAEGYSLREIANIHQVPLSELKEQVRMGMKAESEHTPSKREQMKIVKDHLFENPKYYTLLEKAGLEDGGGVNKNLPNIGSKVQARWDSTNKMANGGSVLENNFPDEVIGNDNILFVKEWEINQNGKNIAHYNIYWKGYDIDFGGHTFESIKSLKKFKENYILSNNLYDKLKYQPEKQISNKSKYNYGGQTESLVRDAKSGNTPARDLNNYNDVIDLQADGMVGADTGIYANGGLIAPNGKSSFLTPEQYKLVRTPEFKAWFGDWENDPENSSKVVDENGEPMVVYHTTSAEFNVFSKKKSKEGFFFAPQKERLSVYNKLNINSYFLNLRNPSHEMFKSDLNYLIPKGYDGIMDYGHAKHLGNKNLYEIIAFEPNQIKLADGTNTTFDAMNPDIRFATGGSVKPYDANMEGDSAHLIKEEKLTEKEINETIETLEILYDSATRIEKKEIKEAIEVLKML